ncbi:MAG: HAD family hydrolase, partial [Rhizobiales bacterium]|nr:HAD family hydrolase [Hyphomicrobiales bacterium]
MSKAATISGILFDKDGTLLDYARSWIPVNYELARIAAAGDEALARRLLVAGGMDPDTGYVTPDSLLAAGNTVEIAEGLVAAGAPFTVEGLATHFDGLFSNSAALAVAVTALAAVF